MTINASDEATGSGLEAVEYSLDAGETWERVSLSALPFHFNVPGSGFFHVVAHVVDKAGNLSAADDRFFIESP